MLACANIKPWLFSQSRCSATSVSFFLLFCLFWKASGACPMATCAASSRFLQQSLLQTPYRLISGEPSRPILDIIPLNES